MKQSDDKTRDAVEDFDKVIKILIECLRTRSDDQGALELREALAELAVCFAHESPKVDDKNDVALTGVNVDNSTCMRLFLSFNNLLSLEKQEGQNLTSWTEASLSAYRLAIRHWFQSDNLPTSMRFWPPVFVVSDGQHRTQNITNFLASDLCDVSSGVSKEHLTELYRGNVSFGANTKGRSPDLLEWQRTELDEGDEGEYGVISPKRMSDLFYGRKQSRHLKRSDEIEAVATYLRKLLGIDDALCPNLFSLVGQLKDVFPGFELRVIAGRSAKFEAMTDCALNIIKIRDDVYRNLQHGHSRARMTFAHEIGHIALCHSGVRQRNVGRGGRRLGKYIREEREASYFAVAFLVPLVLAVRYGSPEEISTQFGVSLEAARIRLREVKVYGSERRGEPRPLPQSVVEFLRQRQRKGDGSSTP